MMPQNSSYIPKLFIGLIVVFSLIVLAFVCLAFNTFTGIVTENAYQKGLEFNKIYQVSLEKPDQAIQADIAIIDTSVHLKVNHPIESSRIEAKLIKPVSAAFDQPLIFRLHSSQHFTTQLPAMTSGVWEVRVKISYQDKEYVFNRRFNIP